jgi:membrane-associated phospholipid phosphatase
MAMEMLMRPYPLSPGILALFAVFVALVPLYIVIGSTLHGRVLHMPALALDRALPVGPAWSLVYGSLYFAMFLPLVVVRRQEQIRRTLQAYLMLWIVAYAVFLAYPTVLPRPTGAQIGGGFCAWVLRIVYSWDGPYNCFPSLHVAQSYLAALTCYRVSRGIGLAAGAWATLVAASTLFTKQHYIADVIAGALMAWVAYAVFLRGCPRAAVPEIDDRIVPIVVLGFVGVHALAIAGFWVAYQMHA